MKYYSKKYFNIFETVIFIIIGIIIDDFLSFSTQSFNPPFWIGLFSFALMIFIINLFSHQQVWMRWLGWMVFGLAISGYESITFNKNAELIDHSSQITGQILTTTYYRKMIQYRVEVNNTKSWIRNNQIIVNVLDLKANFHRGQIIEISSKINRLTGPQNPFEMDGIKYWRPYRVSHQTFTRNLSQISLIKDHRPILHTWYNNIEGILDQLFPDETYLGWTKALLLGRKESINPDLKSNFQKLGCLHILAVSGLHVGLLMTIIYLILLPLRLLIKNQTIIWFIIFLLTWIYVALVDYKIPVVRASILVSFFLFSKIWHRHGSKWHIIAWAALFLVLWQPQHLFSVGFQLSFAAVIGILTFYPSIHMPLIKLNIIPGLSKLIAVSLAAQLATFPIIIYHFNQFSFWGLMSSIAIIPLLFPLLFSIIVAILIYLIYPPFGMIISLITKYIIDLVQFFTESLVHVNMGWPYVYSPDMACLFLIMALIFIGLKINKVISQKWIHQLFILLAWASYAIDCSIIRNNIYLVTYNERNTTIVDLFTGGKVYTNQVNSELPHVLKNRKRHYANSVEEISDLFKVDDFIVQIVDSIPTAIDIRTNVMVIRHNIQKDFPLLPDKPMMIINNDAYARNNLVKINDPSKTFYSSYCSIKL